MICNYNMKMPEHLVLQAESKDSAGGRDIRSPTIEMKVDKK